MSFVIRVIIAIVAVLLINLLIQPLLMPLIPPFGLIVVILLYVGVLFYLLGGYPTVG